MFKFIHAADIHLDSPMYRLEAYEGAPVEEVRQATRRAFENLIDTAVGEPADFLLIAGDLFDGSWKDYNTGLYFVGQMRRLKEAGIPVCVISGNHDAAGKMTRTLPYPENVHVLSHRKPETLTLDSLKVAIHGQSFSNPAVTDNLALAYPDPIAGWFNIGLLHTSLTGREGHENYAPCTLDDLRLKGYDYWALGHVHQYEIASVDPPVVFPGCIQGRHIRESGAKGGVLVSVEDGAAPDIDFQAFDVIRWEHVIVDVQGVMSKQECLDRLKESMEVVVREHHPQPVITRLTFDGATDAHAEIAADPGNWKEVVRSAALSEFGEAVWIEKVIVHMQAKQKDHKTLSDPGPIRELERLVSEIASDDDSLKDLAGELFPLFRKLPAEYREGENAIVSDNPEQIRRIVEQAHALLVRRLKKEAPGS